MGLALPVFSLLARVESVTFSTGCRSAPVTILTFPLPEFKEVVYLRFFVEPFGVGLWLPLSDFLLGNLCISVGTLFGSAVSILGCQSLDFIEFGLKGKDILFLFRRNVLDLILFLILGAIILCLHSLFWLGVFFVLVVLLFYHHVFQKGILRA